LKILSDEVPELETEMKLTFEVQKDERLMGLEVHQGGVKNSNFMEQRSVVA
jgi:hypothetical protein